MNCPLKVYFHRCKKISKDIWSFLESAEMASTTAECSKNLSSRQFIISCKCLKLLLFNEDIAMCTLNVLPKVNFSRMVKPLSHTL